MSEMPDARPGADLDRLLAAAPPPTGAAVDWLDPAARQGPLRWLTLGTVVLVLALLAVSVFVEVDELARARGEMRNLSGTQLLQSEEGGSLAELLVRVDESVKSGQVIARFQTVNVDKAREQTAIRRAALEIDIERHRAIVESRAPDFKRFAAYPRLVAEALSLYRSDSELGRARVGVRSASVEQLRASVASAEAALAPARRELAAARDVESRYADAARTGIVSQVTLQQARERVASAEQNLRQIEGRVADARAGLARAGVEVLQTRDELVTEARLKISEKTEQIRELEAELKALESRRGQRELVAPVDGVIKQLPETRAGAVIPPGGTVAELVPANEPLLLEAQVSPRDIGFVKVGQHASVKLDAFDYSRFGAVQGKVERISPGVFRHPQTGQTFYRVEVSLARNHVGSDTSHRIIAGMSGEADIATGRKSIFQYLTKPVFLTADTAFHER